jgi:WhiB family redox-sensing transcriptional regulator
MTARTFPSYWMTEPSVRPAWWAHAHCRKVVDVKVMHPSNVSELDRALAVCEQCSVVLECGKYALETKQEYGVWGAMSERDRRRILRKKAGLKVRNGQR